MKCESLGLYPNGFIIKATNTEYAKKFITPKWPFNYYGIEGDNWPIDSYSENITSDVVNFINDFIYENVENMDEYEKSIDVCVDLDFINYYIENCKKANLDIDILFVETELDSPRYPINLEADERFEFIGFDYAFPVQDYFSAIYQNYKIISKFSGFRLNKFGLFDIEEEVIKYKVTRHEIIDTHPDIHLEPGQFVIYKIWRYIGQIPLTK